MRQAEGLHRFEDHATGTRFRTGSALILLRVMLHFCRWRVRMRHRVTPEIVDVAALAGFGLNLHHYPGAGTGQPDPVIVVHGAAFRSNLFLAPAKQAFVDALPEAGYRWCRGGS